MATGNELPGKNARAMLPLLEELAEKDAEIERLRNGYRRLRDASDSDMRDGDLAREIATEMLQAPNVI